MEQQNNGYPPHGQGQNYPPQLSPVQMHQTILSQQKGYGAFVKLFELSGYSEEQANFLAQKEAYHLSCLMADSDDLARMPAAALVMELRKIPLLGVSLDPTLKLAYLLVQDKNKGKVSLEVTGRGKAVQSIAQGIISNVDTQVVYEGDTTAMRPNGTIGVVPGFKAGAKVIGGIISIQWPDCHITQQTYSQSHIAAWQARSAKRFKGTANANYFSFNGGMEPGFLESKMLKHKLDKIGINPLPIKREAIERIAATLPETTDKVEVFVEEAEAIEIDAPREQQQQAQLQQQLSPVYNYVPLDQPAGKNYPNHPSFQPQQGQPQQTTIQQPQQTPQSTYEL